MLGYGDETSNDKEIKMEKQFENVMWVEYDMRHEFTPNRQQY